jgi:hypothetical protein
VGEAGARVTAKRRRADDERGETERDEAARRRVKRRRKGRPMAGLGVPKLEAPTGVLSGSEGSWTGGESRLRGRAAGEDLTDQRQKRAERD